MFLPLHVLIGFVAFAGNQDNVIGGGMLHSVADSGGTVGLDIFGMWYGGQNIIDDDTKKQLDSLYNEILNSKMDFYIFEKIILNINF